MPRKLLVVGMLVDTDDDRATIIQIGTVLKPYRAPDTRGDLSVFDPLDADNQDLGLVLEDLALPGAAKSLYALQEAHRG